VVNFLHYPDLYAYVDGRPAAITLDRWERMVIQAPANSRELAVLCQPPWSKGLLLGSAVLLLGILGMLFLEKTGKKERLPPLTPDT
jgi:hypothetical protein